ncbi:DNA-binding MarR family transcriptional regulator [Nocardia tenerifensis]|uniref:DNA-binding MarR family transcriptional regulator n=1 Tax=Nocardia tenerifensis TaxID=228006 RepID=A0A318JKQ6_9NOCA|nr:MarR family transcriptional regulator [Nocardia tenerifensis]PXX53393.1 DNA-binding MarR family transcriptional regulator [Nocardia tenerifensis]
MGPAARSITRDSVDEVTEALLSASRLLMAISARSIAHVDDTITLPQFRTLVILAAQGPVKLATLAQQLDVQPSTATRMVERLLAAELITRQPNPQTRRELIIDLTARGREVVEDVTAKRRREIAGVVKKMPAAQRQGLVDALNAFTEAGGEFAAVDGGQAPLL